MCPNTGAVFPLAGSPRFSLLREISRPSAKAEPHGHLQCWGFALRSPPWHRCHCGSTSRGHVPSSRPHLSPRSPHSAGSMGPGPPQNPQNSPLRTPKGVRFVRGIWHLALLTATLAISLLKVFPAVKSTSQRFKCCSNAPRSGEVQ